MAGHTKGPWVHYDDSNRAIPRHTVVAAGKTVTSIYCTKNQESEDAANARLIAAAPRMFDYVAARAAHGDEEARQIMETVNANS